MPVINISRFLQPPEDSLQVKFLLSGAAQQVNKNYYAACNLVLDAWVISLVDSMRYGIKLLANATIHIFTFNFESLITQMQQDTSNYMKSCKLNIFLPMLLFYSIFSPNTLEQLDYYPIEKLRQPMQKNSNNYIDSGLNQAIEQLELVHTASVSSEYPVPVEGAVMIFQTKPATYPADIHKHFGITDENVFCENDWQTKLNKNSPPTKVLFVVYHTARLESVNLDKNLLRSIKEQLGIFPNQIKVIALTPGNPQSSGAADGCLSSGESVGTVWFYNGQLNQEETNKENIQKIYHWLKA